MINIRKIIYLKNMRYVAKSVVWNINYILYYLYQRGYIGFFSTFYSMHINSSKSDYDYDLKQWLADSIQN